MGAIETMEKTMRVLTLTELMRITRTELCDLAARITNALPGLPVASSGYANARINLRNMREHPARSLGVLKWIDSRLDTSQFPPLLEKVDGLRRSTYLDRALH